MTFRSNVIHTPRGRWLVKPESGRIAALILITGISMGMVGCGTAEGLGRVTGVVKLDGQPVPDASVEFTPVDGKGLTSYGRTDKSGYYEMMATRTEKGAAIGQNRVKISTHEVIDNSHSVPEKIPTKYNSATELSADVKSGSNTFDFELSSAGGRIVNRKNDPSNQ